MSKGQDVIEIPIIPIKRQYLSKALVPLDMYIRNDAHAFPNLNAIISSAYIFAAVNIAVSSHPA